MPLAYEAIQWAGAGYLLWLAWSAVRPGARSPLELDAQLPFLVLLHREGREEQRI